MIQVVSFRELDKALWREVIRRAEEAERKLKIVRVILATSIREIES